MGLGDTAKKLQKVVDAAEQLYAKMNEVIEQLKNVKGQVEETGERVEHLERDVAEQRALVEALAEQEGIDVEETLAAADLPEPEGGSEDDGGGTGAGDTGETAPSTTD
jgi:septal ring factor EnvC (AmiA/AmiB activator)